MGQTTMGRVEYTHEDMAGLEAELQEQLYDANRRNDALTKRIEGLRGELTRIQDCDWVISPMRDIARKALENDDKESK